MSHSYVSWTPEPLATSTEALIDTRALRSARSGLTQTGMSSAVSHAFLLAMISLLPGGLCLDPRQGPTPPESLSRLCVSHQDGRDYRGTVCILRVMLSAVLTPEGHYAWRGRHGTKKKKTYSGMVCSARSTTLIPGQHHGERVCLSALVEPVPQDTCPYPGGLSTRRTRGPQPLPQPRGV